MIRVLFNKKGGVGKSSLAVNLAAISALKGNKTLIVDLDTQCNASGYLNMQSNNNIADFFEQQITFHIKRKSPIEYCQHTDFENLDIICGSEGLNSLETELDKRHKIYKLKDALTELSGHYDNIFIDTAPAYNFYSLSALIAANTCLIPIDCDDFARQGLYKLITRIDEIKEDHNPDLIIEGIIANQFVANANLPKKIIEELNEEGFKVLNNHIHHSVKMKESHQIKKPLCYFAPKHKLTNQLIDLFNEINAK